MSTPRTYEDCLAEHINPNPNPEGRIDLPTDPATIAAHVIKMQAESLRLLAK